MQGYYVGGYPLGGLTLPGGAGWTLEQLCQELKPITERLDRLEAGQSELKETVGAVSDGLQAQHRDPETVLRPSEEEAV